MTHHRWLPAELPGHLVEIGIEAAWRNGYTGNSRLRVAIVDSGVDVREGSARIHMNDKNPHIKEHHVEKRLVFGRDFTGSREDRRYVDEFGHGTKMAGIIGARSYYDGVVGMVPELGLCNYKVANLFGRVQERALAAAIDELLLQNQEERIHVALFAFEATVWKGKGELVESVFDRLREANVLTVVAAEDPKAESVPDHPVRLLKNRDTMLVVAPTGEGKAICDIRAPGRDVVTVAPMAPVPASGSSPAAAIVAGAAALLFGKDPSLPAADVRKTILEKLNRDGELDLRPLGQAG